ncbi:MAG: hypothetical protein P8Z00_12220 [Anaerolineales bacterium]|jgi:hypothetical protein
MRKVRRFFGLVVFIFLASLALASSSLPNPDPISRARAFTRKVEFDYLGWILNALGVKMDQLALNTSTYLTPLGRSDTVREYLRLVDEIQQVDARINDIYADPSVKDPLAASQDLRHQLQTLRSRRDLVGPVAEATLQSQVSEVAASMGLTLGGQPIPPVLYHSTPLPEALIISPRTVIRQDADISLAPGMTVEQKDRLENQVDNSLNVSSLVVEIGGVGVYPTMVEETGDLNWLSEVVSHEWTHNFLTLRPLGASYMNNPALRTMNETTASIAGKEIGREVIKRYYPDLLPPEAPASPQQTSPPGGSGAAVFDFRAEMHTTRLEVDRLLAAGKVDQAEKYMDQRRVFFWNHGYHIRKLNQAYFAFYGAYADQPGGAAGNDPVGTAVRALRADSPSLAVFLNRISWMWSFDQLQQAVDQTTN